MLHQKYVDEYITLWTMGAIKLNQDRINLINWIKRVVLIQKNFYFDEKQIDNCISFIETFYFKLEPFQKFLIAFTFLMDKETGGVVFDEHFWTMARGGGKNGLISGLSNYFISYLHGVEGYDVAITANSENQGQTSFKEVYKMLNKHPELEEDGYFYKTKENIYGIDTDSNLTVRANNASTQDSFRDGALFFDEIHQYETWDTIEVQTSGLGKVKFARTFYVGTNGFVRDAVYDTLIERSREILLNDELIDTMFPFICTLDSPEEVNDECNWEKANPMFSEPMSDYAIGLKQTVRKQWRKIQAGIGNKAKWLVKRMNLMGIKQQSNVATQEEIKATNREYGNLNDLPCIGSVDFSSVKDFTAMGLLFFDEETGEYKWLTHSFVLKQFLDIESLPAPIDEWEAQGLLTKLDGESITEQDVVEWFVQMRELYFFDTIVTDSFRATTLKPVLEEAGFTVVVIRRSTGVQAMIGTLIESLFAKRKIVFGTPTMMNWYTFNVYVKRDKDGNPRFEKKEFVKRKTDGFMAFIHALYVLNEQMPSIVQEDFAFDDYW